MKTGITIPQIQPWRMQIYPIVMELEFHIIKRDA